MSKKVTQTKKQQIEESSSEEANTNRKWEFSPFFGTEGYLQRVRPLKQLRQADLLKLKYATRLIICKRRPLKGTEYSVQCFFVNYQPKENILFYSYMDPWTLPQLYRQPCFKDNKSKQAVFEHMANVNEIVFEKSYVFENI